MTAANPQALVERAQRVNRRYGVGGKDVFPNVYLAPMSGVTDISFRRLVSRLAGGWRGPEPRKDLSQNHGLGVGWGLRGLALKQYMYHRANDALRLGITSL